MQALKFIKQVKNGKTSIDNIPKEFGNEVEIIILPLKNKKMILKKRQKKTLLDLAGKTPLPSSILTELEKGRDEDRF